MNTKFIAHSSNFLQTEADASHVMPTVQTEVDATSVKFTVTNGSTHHVKITGHMRLDHPKSIMAPSWVSLYNVDLTDCVPIGPDGVVIDGFKPSEVYAIVPVLAPGESFTFPAIYNTFSLLVQIVDPAQPDRPGRIPWTHCAEIECHTHEHYPCTHQNIYSNYYEENILEVLGDDGVMTATIVDRRRD